MITFPPVQPLDLSDPRTGQVRTQLAPGGPDEVTAAVAAARGALGTWAGLTAKERSHRLLALVAAIETQIELYVRQEVAGTGKSVVDARAEVLQAADVLRFYAGAVRADLTPAAGQRLPGRESWVRWEPIGVVAAIVPWNYPLLMAAWRLGPALAAGNTVVLKPAQTTPDTAVLLARHAAETLGPGVLVALPGDRGTGRLLVGAAVDAVAFTGSQAGGLDVVTRAGLRRVSLELGGNCAAVVLPDAPDDTYAAIVAACTYNAGQSCAAPARVLTLRSHHDEAVERLAAAMSARRAGPDFGPLNNPDQLARFDAIAAESMAGVRRSGPLALADGETDGFWRAGLILADLPPDDPAVTREMFGPALTVQAADDVDGLIALANSVPQALAASVWGSAVGVALRVAGELDCGEVWVNCHLEQTAELPHGGRRGSGHGTDLSVLALTEYQRPKTVTVRLD
ncbi:aldehyde dehydrogenase family protein [Dactylosporangium sp. AC04546]|uniref:aldehyde dehydrogenase family protein n=1 Tax=Dactylosporangium sp. AC04546 TaxID=2862460 RepID=UPI001EE136D0|nr:aldehyde dehydrogenase family protein [Dactylosporangium sp. AC04546]WVK80795.1 aldehyde dehydrogenase family protein [Dactylosporangium sp. AC04546]